MWKLPKPFTSDGGAAFQSALDCGIEESTIAFLLEDDRTIGVGDSLHQDIRDHGGGLFSVCDGVVRLSSSDCSDCNTNGRDYKIATLEETVLKDIAIRSLAADTTSTLRAIAANSRLNNSFFVNFFTYYRGICDSLKRNALAFPASILEIGCGQAPYLGLRFLLEGAASFVANDIIKVQSLFSSDFVSALRDGCDAIDCALCRNATHVFKPEDGAYAVAGLEALGNISFDDIKISEQIDLIVSISALEHVRDPRRVARKMAELLPSGGLMWHSIDFRDHRDFDRPLEFLKLTADEYAPIATENRLRASDWIGELEQSGFEVLERMDG
ncbi:MAG: class I SAM-dependent methyltransferase, partial [Acetobacteraceae bacterium]